jgi:hypothetical protein
LFSFVNSSKLPLVQLNFKARFQRKEEEAIAEILCLRKQQDCLCSKGMEMIRWGLRTMDELDEAEERERQEEERACNKAATTVPDQAVADPYDFDALALDYAVWAEMGSAGRNS